MTIDSTKSAATATTKPSSPTGLSFARTFSSPEIDPFDAVTWKKSTAAIKDEAGNVIFSQEVEAPDSWSDQAVRVVASKYFYGDIAGGDDPAKGGRESSARQLVGRVTHTIARWGLEDGYFATEQDAKVFDDELTALCVNQYGSFNSPVWFNVGLSAAYGIVGAANGWRWDGAKAVKCEDAYKNCQSAACFILSVADDMESILERAKTEGMLFKYGSGVGADSSKLRSTREKLSSGGKPSGPVSFIRIYDSVAAQIKSGGAVRRAARMDTLKDWHPDVMEFAEAKTREDGKARALVAAGYSGGMNGEASATVAFQNANFSVRCSDKFLQAVEAGGDWTTKAVTTGKDVETFPAGRLMDAIAEGTWVCGDPGVQYEDVIQKWHTCPNTAPINSSNPCLRRGTRLLTDDGWKAVEDIAGPNGQSSPAILHDGVGFSNGEVWRTGRKPIFRLHTNSGETIDLTGDHRVYTTEGWIEAAACEGKTLPRSIPNVGSTGDNRIPKAITGVSGRFYSHPAIDLMEALGFLQGDGGFRDGVATIYFTPEKDGEFIEESVMPILQDIAADRGEIDYKASPLSEGSTGYKFCRKRFTDWLAAMGFVFAPLPQRTLPGFLWSVKQNAQAAFLRGLFGANGNILRDARLAVNLVSTCREMLQEVQIILRAMGIISSVRVHNKPQEIDWENGHYVSKESYRLEITHQQDISAFARLIGFPQASQQAKLAEIVKSDRADKRDGGFAKRAYMEVIRVENLDIEDDVYDFRCPTTSMGIANGVLVHNCSEFMFLDETSCNLASLNLMKFRRPDGTFDTDRFRAACRVFLVAQEIIVDRSSYPTEKISENSHKFRPLGLGYCGLGALLMSSGLPYHSDEGRSLAGAVTAIMHGQANLTSAEMAEKFGAFEGYAVNREPMMKVMGMHREAAQNGWSDSLEIESSDINALWNDAVHLWWDVIDRGNDHGFRNSQVTVLAPTGTIAFMMDSGHSTGMEPGIGLVQYKTLAGGGMLKIVNPVVGMALKTLGYGVEIDRSCNGDTERFDRVAAILEHVENHDTIEDVILQAEGVGSHVKESGLKPEHLPVFDCAFSSKPDGRSIHWQGHVKMMGALQPFLSGAISKTVNLPREATVAEIRAAYLEAWKLGIKAVAIFRDGSKESQPVSTSKTTAMPANPEGISRLVSMDEIKDIYSEGLQAGLALGRSGSSGPRRSRLPDTRNAVTHKLSISAVSGYVEAYLTVGEFPDGRPGEVFVTMAKEGSTLGGLMDGWATAVSIMLQYGIPVDVIVKKFEGGRFEPAGMTRNSAEIPIASSLLDYVARWLGMRYVAGYREAYAPRVEGAGDPADSIGSVGVSAPSPTEVERTSQVIATASHGPLCGVCGGMTIPTGRCWTCASCGTSVGGCG